MSDQEMQEIGAKAAGDVKNSNYTAPKAIGSMPPLETAVEALGLMLMMASPKSAEEKAIFRHCWNALQACSRHIDYMKARQDEITKYEKAGRDTLALERQLEEYRDTGQVNKTKGLI